MPFFVWEPDLSVGVNQFDEEHQVLINYINKLHTGMLAGDLDADMEKILDGLIKYTEVHFIHEQDLMIKHEYPEYDQHKSIHDNFVSKIIDFKKDFENGRSSFSLELMSFLKDWLIGHIQGTDQKYKDFFKDKVVS